MAFVRMKCLFFLRFSSDGRVLHGMNRDGLQLMVVNELLEVSPLAGQAVIMKAI